MATVAQIRALIADPTGASQVFDDDHYQIILDLESNTYRAAADAARTLSAHFAQQVSVTAGPVKIENQQKALRYQELAKDYDQRAREGAGDGDGGVGSEVLITGIDEEEIRNVRDDKDRYNSSFYRGIHNNPSELTDENNYYCD